ncbi:MAG: tRNA uridine-5-carboxymethylaminomethyl(34) synthesis GTPase MnmE [Acidobacteriota bacterium]|nr:tRNA uridine-5-carboxymethylaminomethyl(34) synthesis GTPase MnmE [Acidobacteriota bacterium]
MRPALAAFDETIAALATGAGRNALAVVRVSGRAAGEILSRIAPALPSPPPPRQARLADVVDAAGETIDRAVLTFFPGPASATGEDVLEISVHGGPAIVRRALEAVTSAGARLARPGEFTERAFLLGRIDLLEAEAVRDLIDARTPEALRASARRMDGALSRELGQIREELSRAAAELAATIDFAEDVGESLPQGTVDRVGRAATELERLAAGAERGRLLAEGARLVFLGPPNAGKSTLFNALAGTARAIVTDTPGTTRDTLDAAIDVEGVPVEIVDTAGLRDTRDEVERIGVARARDAGVNADAVLYVFDAGRGWSAEDERALRETGCARTLVIANKIDLAPGAEVPPAALPLCGLASGAGAALRASILALLDLGPPPEATSRLLGSARQRDLARGAAAAARNAHRGLSAAESPEYPAAQLDEALAAMADLFGETTTEDVLRRIFSTFCIGK